MSYKDGAASYLTCICSQHLHAYPLCVLKLIKQRPGRQHVSAVTVLLFSRPTGDARDMP